jgi:hypothetical protein
VLFRFLSFWSIGSMIVEAKRDLCLQGELENLSDRRLPIQHALCQEELLVLTSFFELLASWEIRAESNVR